MVFNRGNGKMFLHKMSGFELACAVKTEHDDPVENIVGPLGPWEQGGRYAEGREQSGDLSMAPGNQRMTTVRLGAEQRNQLDRSFGADRGVELEARSFAERFQGLAWADAVFRVRAGIERVDSDIQVVFAKGLEVLCVGLSPGLSGRSEFRAGGWLLRMTNDQNGILGEVVFARKRRRRLLRSDCKCAKEQ